MNFVISRLLDNFNIDFLKYKKISHGLSAFLILLTLILLFTRGLNFGIDFTGGLLFELKAKTQIANQDFKDIRLALANNTNLSSAAVQLLNQTNLSIKFKSQSGEKDIQLVKNILAPYNFNYEKIEYIGPQVSRSLLTKGISALILACVGIFIYLTIMFNLRYSTGGVLSLLHDVVIILGIYTLFKIEFNLSGIAAILTVIGYSINDTVVIFDRIREYSHKISDKINLINYSINSTLSRTILTSLTTLLATMPIIFFCSGEIQNFAIIIFSGVIIGTYSSIFIASTLLLPTAASIKNL